jgi:hypothetical protein
MEKRWMSLVAVLCVVCGFGCAKQETAASAPATVVAQTSGPGSASTLFVTSATVLDVDQKTRNVTLRTAEGETVNFHADESVRNLAQVKKGDEVDVTYLEAIALRLRDAQGEKPGVSVAESLERAQVGEKPAGTMVRTTTLTAKVKAIDKTKQTVTLEGPEGRSVTVNVRDPLQLEKAKVGKLVEATYREAVNITVRAPSK